MRHTKKELQEMLREMGVKFSHTASYANLQKLFQEENHRRWLGLSPAGRQLKEPTGKKVVRRKKAASPPSAVSRDSRMADVQAMPSVKHDGPKPRQSPPVTRPPMRRAWGTRDGGERIIESSGLSAGGDRQVHVHVFESVLRRAGDTCELCNLSRGDAPLEAFQIIPPEQGGQLSIKNTVALCPGCHQRLLGEAKPADLKILKRKARGRVIRAVQILRK